MLQQALLHQSPLRYLSNWAKHRALATAVERSNAFIDHCMAQLDSAQQKQGKGKGVGRTGLAEVVKLYNTLVISLSDILALPGICIQIILSLSLC